MFLWKNKKKNYLTSTLIYYSFNITRKYMFCFVFYFEWKYFVLIDHILSETICLFCSCVFFSQIFTLKLNLQPKLVWSVQLV